MALMQPTAFDDICIWSAYDPGARDVGVDPDGYHGAVFDGRYVYFAPSYNGDDYHGEVLRYDTRGPFRAPDSWTTFDPGDHGVGTDPDGYYGVCFDGRYVYFSPAFNGTAHHGEVLRLDTTGAFTDARSWSTYDAGENGIGSDPDGYYGATFDGRYVYFSPYNNGGGQHGEVLRYDTDSPFDATVSWTTFDPGAGGVGIDPDGYVGGAFDGRYVYFAPLFNGSGNHGEVLRLDTQGNFLDSSGWAVFDPGDNGVGTDPDGYFGAAFDGRHVYFAPNYNGTERHGEVLRFDTSGGFADPQSWSTFDPGAAGIGNDPDGYYGLLFDGRYVYFTPYENGDERHGEALRLDTLGDFASPDSWSAFDPGAAGRGVDPDGYFGAAFDGRYVYFSPAHSGTDFHGEVLRYDTYAPLGEWTFDEGAGEVAHDGIRGRDGTVHGAVWIDHDDGYALQFDGQDDWIDMGTGAFLSGVVLKEFAAEVDVKPAAVDVRPERWEAAIYHATADGEFGLGVWRPGGRATGVVYTGEDRVAVWLYGPVITDGAWHTLRLAKSVTAVALYVDGEKHDAVAFVEALTVAERGSLSIGARHTDVPSDLFAGAIDNVHLHNAAVKSRFDCNANEISDDCEMISGGDFNADASVDAADFAGFFECMMGPSEMPAPTYPACIEMCLEAFDADADRDVDHRDFASFQAVMGPKP